MEKIEVGHVVKRMIRTRVCKDCGSVIDGTLCHYGCLHDGEMRRPKGSVEIRTWERVDTLLAQEDE